LASIGRGSAHWPVAAPVVSGSAALLLSANPNLTPALVKAILRYTAAGHGSAILSIPSAHAYVLAFLTRRAEETLRLAADQTGRR